MEEPDIWAILPDDVQQRVLDMFSPAECERFSLVSHSFKVLARRSEAWKRSYLFQLDYPVKGLPDEYRPLSLERIRIRYDGVYFAKCSYNRVIGAGQSLTVSRTFVSVVYYRFFRFYPDGSAAMVTQPADLSSGEPRAPVSVYELLIALSSPQALVQERTRLEKASVVCYFSTEAERVTFRYNDGRNQWLGRLRVSAWKYKPGAILRWERYWYWNSADYRRHLLDSQDNTAPVDDWLLEESEIPRELLCSINLRTEQHFPSLKFKADRRLNSLF